MVYVVRFYDLEGEECWLDIRDGVFLENGASSRQVDHVAQFGPLVKSWGSWASMYRRSSREAWSKYILRVVSVVLGLKVRCILVGDVFYAPELVGGLLDEFFPSLEDRRRLGLSSDAIIDYLRIGPLMETVQQRRVLRDEDHSRGLSARFRGMGPRMEEHARFYEWDTWPDVLMLLGECNAKKKGREEKKMCMPPLEINIIDVGYRCGFLFV